MHQPRIELRQFEVRTSRQYHFVKNLLSIEKLQNSEGRIFVEGEIEPRDIEADKVQAIVDSIVIGIVFEKRVVPRLKVVASQQIQFEMHVCALAIDSFAGVTHHRNRLTLFDRLAWLRRNRAQVPI